MRNLIIVILVFSVFSCTKLGKNVTVKGVVKNPITGETYEGLKVHLLVGETFALPGGKKEIKSTITDANGRFELSAGRTKDVIVQLYEAGGKYRIGWYENGEYKGSSGMKLSKGKTMEVEYHLVPYSFSKLIINNVNCQGPDDLFVLYRGNQLGTIDDTFGWEHEGCVYWETNGYSEILMGEVYYRWEVTRSGNTEVFYDTVFYPAGANITYEINY